ncbi:hypothetical protein Xmau_03053 [Xenorhabdus mauleonii]|uniref:Uncharacterized protein n=1 Tax=Xenorhabdus mauleonii TaxID=351675 RepID=A0A1I3SH92_9GAMM|nr:hypothetical protein [Xenorhabdus mauleonii]PHM39148.1 hypothetical protein Xmau_03053 [Xenorhabdus mauleonii]SFJ56806.1 hypothetical protein SAMN05421680_11174 [Xenorhabdus mauleonii]
MALLDALGAKPHKADLVRSVLTKENDNPTDQLIVCLIIVFRFRNNFFHGLKWAYELRGQLGNFTHSIALLKKYLAEVKK